MLKISREFLFATEIYLLETCSQVSQAYATVEAAAMRSVQVMNRDTMRELFERIPKEANRNVIIRDFIAVYFDAEEILRQKILNTAKVLEDIQLVRKQYVEKLEEISDEEQLNAYGLMKDAYLDVTIIAGANFIESSDSMAQPSVSLRLGQETFESGVAIRRESGVFYWSHVSHRL